MSRKRIKRIKPISTEWMKLSHEELGKIEVIPGMSLEMFYEEIVRKKCCEAFKEGKYVGDILTLTWLARQTGMSRGRFNRVIFPKLKRFDEQFKDRKIRCRYSQLIYCGEIFSFLE